VDTAVIEFENSELINKINLGEIISCLHETTPNNLLLDATQHQAYCFEEEKDILS
jgi:hypothetical protein